MIEKVVSGGQTGVDLAALDAAQSHWIPIGGWCPHDRRNEEGRIPAHYPLKKIDGGYQMRTEQNVIDSDGTLLIFRGKPGRGTQLTMRLLEKHGKPSFWVNPDVPQEPANVWHWINQNKVKVLNVAGTRESGDEGIYEAAYEYLMRLFQEM